MKKLLLFIITVLLFYSCKRNIEKDTTDNFSITGTIKITFNNSNVYLKTQENGILVMLDSTTIENGKFEFKGSINKPVVYGIFIDSIKGTIGIFMENKAITIEAYEDSLSSSKISGSKTNNDYLNFVRQSNQIISKMNVLFPVFQKARAENDVEKLEIINAKMQAINDENTSFALSYAKQHPDSYISAMALHSTLRVPSIHRDTILKIYDNFSDFVKKGDFAVETLQFLETSRKNDSIKNKKFLETDYPQGKR